MMSSIYKDKALGTFQERNASVIVQIKKDEKIKSVGACKLNLVDYVNEKTGKKVRLPLDKCPDKKACIEFTVKAT